MVGGMFTFGGAVRQITFQQGETIFAEGDPGDAMYIVESGSVGIVKTVEGEKVKLATLSAGGLFGEMAVIDGSKRMAAAVALEDCGLIRVPRDVLVQKLSQYDPFLQALLKILITNLRNVHQAYAKRPRGLDDYVNAIAYHADGLRQYLETAGAAALKKDLLPRVAALDQAVGELRGRFRESDAKTGTGSGDKEPSS